MGQREQREAAGGDGLTDLDALCKKASDEFDRARRRATASGACTQFARRESVEPGLGLDGSEPFGR